MKKVFFIFIILIIGFITPLFCQAATASLYLSPSSGTYTVGNNFSIAVKINSGGALINAADGSLNFNSSQLQVLSVSKSNSIFSLWTQEPTFSNSAGIIRFGGGTPSGFSGASGEVFTVSFKSKMAATAEVKFLSGSVLAADGKGTNILSSFGSGIYTLFPTTITPPAEEYLPPTGTPAAPVISSPTHPDSEKWYSNNDPEFIWEVTKDITAVRLLIDHSPFTVPTVFYSEPISEKQLEDLEDGIWYFHVQLQNQFGWGETSHFKFQIDTEKPKIFETTVDNGGDPTNPTPIIHFKAIDYISGIEYYDVKIGEEENIIPVKLVGVVASNPYEMPLQSPGKHTVIIKAVDSANNETLSALDVVIEPIETPTITEYPKELTSNEVFIAKGTTYPNVQVVVWLQKEKEDAQSHVIESDGDGNFTFIADEKLKDGVYKLWAEVIDERGARSKPTEKVTIAIEQPAFLKIGNLAVSILAVIVPLVALIIFLLVLVWYGWHKFSLFRKRVRKETKEAKEALYQAFDALKEETEEQVAKLDGEPDLSEREKKICNNLKKALKNSEKFIGKEVKDIEKELK